MIGAIFFCAGYVTASISRGNILLLILGLGVINGIGMALAYITIISIVNRWLSNNKGLATGIATPGFGGGAVVVSIIAELLLAAGTFFGSYGEFLGRHVDRHRNLFPGLFDINDSVICLIKFVYSHIIVLWTNKRKCDKYHTTFHYESKSSIVLVNQSSEVKY